MRRSQRRRMIGYAGSCGRPTVGRARQPIVYDPESLREYSPRPRACRKTVGADRSVSRGRVRGGRGRHQRRDRVVIGGISSTARTRASIPATPRAFCRRTHRRSCDAAMRERRAALAKALGVVGLINVQYAVKNGVVYVLEVNPRAKPTIPFVVEGDRRAARVVAARSCSGSRSPTSGAPRKSLPTYVSVKEAVFPFKKFAGTDPISSGDAVDRRKSGNLRFLWMELRQGQLAAGTDCRSRGRSS